MPITIKELVVRATIKEVEKEKSFSSYEPKGDNDFLLDKRILMDEIIEQVVEIFHQKQDR